MIGSIQKPIDIVRVDWDLQLGGTRTYNAAVTPPMAEVFVRDFPEVEAAPV